MSKTLSEIHAECKAIFEKEFYETDWRSNACKVYDTLTEGCEDKEDCIGENFNQLIQQIVDEWFTNYKPGAKVDYYFYNYILLLYLFVERVDLIFAVVNKDDKSKIFRDFHQMEFPALRRINKWANFIKHPKEFLFTHWPYFYFPDESPPTNPGDVVIDYEFIKQHYYSEKQPPPKVLENNNRVYVAMPDLVDLTQRFCNEMNVFFDFICSNKLVADFLRKKSTIEEIYSSDDDDEDSEESSEAATGQITTG